MQFQSGFYPVMYYGAMPELEPASYARRSWRSGLGLSQLRRATPRRHVRRAGLCCAAAAVEIWTLLNSSCTQISWMQFFVQLVKFFWYKDLHDYLAFKRNLYTAFCSISEIFFTAINIRCGRIVTDFLSYPKFRKNLLSWYRFCDTCNTTSVQGLTEAFKIEVLKNAYKKNLGQKFKSGNKKLAQLRFKKSKNTT